MLTQLNPPMPLMTPKGKALAYFIIDYGIEHDLYWICFLDSTGEGWTFKNPEIRAQLNITEGRDYISPFYDPDSVKLNKTEDHSYFDAISRRYDRKCDCEHQQASKTVRQQDDKYEWTTNINPNPNIAWIEWSEYLPDEGRFYFFGKESDQVFLGIRRTNYLKVIEIKLDARYSPENHGAIEGWKPYEG